MAGTGVQELRRGRFAKMQGVSLGNRFLYEAGGNLGLQLFMRQAKGRDFREFLAAWYRPSFPRTALVPLVARLWKNPGRCAHRLGEHWCRVREKEIRAPELGLIAPKA